MCTSVCQNFQTRCASLLNATGESSQLPADCTVYAADGSGCVTFPFSSSLPAGFTCPDPLVVNPYPTVENPYCVGMCCTPCPQPDLFYKKGQLAATRTVVSVCQLISLVLCFFVALSYFMMPEKRQFPAIIIPCLSLSLLIMYVGWTLSAGNVNRVACNNEIIPAMPLDNENPTCVAQSK